MEKLFVPYKIAKTLKALGFDDDCICLYKIEEYDQIPIPKFFAIDQHWGSGLSGLSPTHGDTIRENECLAPMYQQVQDWLREKHKIHIELLTMQPDSWLITLQFLNSVTEHGVYNGKRIDIDLEELGTYYEALDKAIEKALTLIK